jgi:Glutamine phosphoribosylpyrophosphate amidotransferase
MVGQVYDITYGAVKPTDNLVIIDDSIVRGTTLKKSILSILDRCGAKHVVVVSSAPQIRYPDCYGIDMAKIGDFVAFKAAIALLEETNQMHILQAAYEEAKSMQDLPKSQWRNCVKDIYASFTYEEVTAKITELLRPANMESEVSIVFQTVDDLHKAIPKHLGDWYFTGNYPTQGGIKVVNRALINFVEKNNQRAY